MKKVLALALYGLLFWGSAEDARARSFFIASNGSDSNAGTLSSPWRTISKANGTLVAGDTVYLRGGSYAERIIPANSGLVGRPIVYRSYPGEYVLLIGAPTGEINIAQIYQNYVELEGLNFRNQNFLKTLSIHEYWVILGGKHLAMRRCRLVVDGDAYYNVYTLHAYDRAIADLGQYNIIENCFVRGFDIGICIAGPSAPRYSIVRNDTVYATCSNNIDVASTTDGSTGYHCTLIENCILDSSSTEDNIQFEPDYNDIKSYMHNRGTIIRNNRMGNAAENAIDLKGAGHTFIYNNLIYSSQGDDDGPWRGNDTTSGAAITGCPNNPTRFTIVHHNVIWDHLTGIDMAEGDHYFNNTLLNARRSYRGPNRPFDRIFTLLRAFSYPSVKRGFVNNIVGYQADNSVIDFRMDYGDKFTLDYNMYIEPSGSPKYYHRENGTMITTVGLAAWKKELSTYAGYAYMQGKEAHSQETDPQFVNLPTYPYGYDAGWDFGLRAGSPAIDAGAATTTATTGGNNTTALRVDDPYYFCDGLGIADGDVIRIGSSDAVRIVSIDYAAGLISLESPRNWSAGDGVSHAYSGNAPDIGAREFTGASSGPVGPSVPRLLAPADGATGMQLLTSLQWEAVSGATGYQVQVATGTDFVNPVLNQSVSSVTSLMPSAIAYGSRYYWRVRAYNAAGSSSWSSASGFTTRLDTTSATTLRDVMLNGSFESSLDSWLFYTNGMGTCDQVSLGGSSGSAARIVIQQEGSNTQLHQAKLTLDPDAFYELSFLASSATGNDVAVCLFKNTTPFTSYGITYRKVDLGTAWKRYTIHFKTQNFSTTVTDGRLMFWFTNYALAGDVYWIDSVSLKKSLPPSPPFAPSFAYPAGEASNLPGMIALGWNSVQGAEEYQLQLSTDSLFSSIAMDRTVSDTFAVVGPLQPGKKYFRRVRSLNIGGAGLYCTTGSMSTRIPMTVASRPAIVSPSNGQGDVPVVAKVLWSRAQEADWYDMQVATDSLFLSLFWEATQSDTSITIGPFQSATTYYVRVRGGNSAGNSAYTSLNPFVTQTLKTGVDDVEQVPTSYRLEQNYPNPFNPATVIRYALPGRSEVNLKVYNILGAEVANLVQGEQTAGVHEVRFSGTSLASGVYFYSLVTPSYRETRKMLLVK
jgi:hypothetical protein